MNKHVWSALAAALIATGRAGGARRILEINTKMEMPWHADGDAGDHRQGLRADGQREKNPQHMQPKDSKCQMNDVKTSGNKGELEGHLRRARRDHDRHRRSGPRARQLSRHHAHEGQLRRPCHRHDADLQRQEDRRRLIRSPGQTGPEMVGKMCDSSVLATDWIARSDMFLRGNTCPGKKELRAAVRRDAARDANAYRDADQHREEQQRADHHQLRPQSRSHAPSVCKANMTATTASSRPTAPAEARNTRKWRARKNCEGRSYGARSSAGCPGRQRRRRRSHGRRNLQGPSQPAAAKTGSADAKGKGDQQAARRHVQHRQRIRTPSSKAPRS